MARLQCRDCGFDQEIEWDGRLVCPSCGSTNARAAVGTTELSDAEIDMIMRSEIPEELRWNSSDDDTGDGAGQER
ncbi:hypothetical protein ACNHKD_14820 [Methylocystis sp. JAN1]|uniref:hypothetical protein n=1 Tax=Methylocystis sp. JAN1 TaxID=3397211 RepID=UPI003FA20EE0